MMSSSTSLERIAEAEEGLPLPKAMECLNDTQLDDLINVVAQDMQLRYDLAARLHEFELNLVRNSDSHPQRQGGCDFCPSKFGLISRGVQCRDCSRVICRMCLHEGVCPVCCDVRKLSYRKKEWLVLVGHTESMFGYAKMFAFDNDRISHENWILRARIELHLTHMLETNLDAAIVTFRVMDPSLEHARQQLAIAITEYDAKTHFGFIDDLVESTKDIVHRRSNSLCDSSIDVRITTYAHLLANAVVRILVAADCTSTPGLAISKTGAAPLRSMFSNIATPESVIPVTIGLGHRFVPNWLFKGSFETPMGAPSSQTSSYMIVPVTTPPTTFHVNDNNNNEAEENSDDDSVESIFLSDSGLVSVCMTQRQISAKSGQVVSISASFSVIGVDGQDSTKPPNDVDVLWFNGHRQLTDRDPRYQIYSSKNSSRIEIFDCTRVDDAGEIVCAVVTATDIAADSAVLAIVDDDIAGDEPVFAHGLHLRPPLETAAQGLKAVLECQVYGYPQPYVCFYRNKKPIRNEPGKFHIDHKDNVWYLEINKCTDDDNGLYTAVAMNRIGFGMSKFRISVRPVSFSMKF